MKEFDIIRDAIEKEGKVVGDQVVVPDDFFERLNKSLNPYNHSLLNGEVWKSPSCLYAITQWLDGNQWVLLGAPCDSIWGGKCMTAMSEPDGKIIFAGMVLEERLRRNGWTRCPTAELQLAV